MYFLVGWRGRGIKGNVYLQPIIIEYQNFRQQSRGMGICYMVCLVVVTIISAIAGIMYIQLVSLCAIFEADVCLGMSVPPLVFLVAEATFAIAAAVLTG